MIEHFPGFDRFRDGRERCTKSVRGRNEYAKRGAEAWERDGGICGICDQPVGFAEFTIDHVVPRGLGGGTRDDRVENLQPAHFCCNSEKGSKRRITRDDDRATED